jgi:iron complex transport system permease protein
VSERGLNHLTLLLPALLIGGWLIGRQRRLLVALSLGEQVAASLGQTLTQGSRQIILGAALLVGSSVAIAGNIGFVGLLVPHLVRPLAGHRPDRILLPSALFGAALVGLADICVRLLPPEHEIKLGVLTSLLGTPLFIWLIGKDKRRWL